jgi:D-glycerate 3-kinase
MEILHGWINGHSPNREELEELLIGDLPEFNSNIESIKKRSQIFIDTHQDVINLANRLGLTNLDKTLKVFWKLWLPLGLQIVEKKSRLDHPLIQGILGGQGTGKTTLAAMLQLIIAYLGYSSISISLDDLYKTYPERQQLQQQDPRLIWRGPPGTHDVQLGITVLDRLRQKSPEETVLIPRFDKSAYQGLGDRAKPEIVQRAEVIIFEGWFVGLTPIDDSNFHHPPPPIVTPEDKLFARDMNEKLKEYLPLWDRLDGLIILKPRDYRWSKIWRKEAEQKTMAQGKAGMSDRQIEEFVEYFWKALHPQLFLPALTNNSSMIDMLVEINADHSPAI